MNYLKNIILILVLLFLLSSSVYARDITLQELEQDIFSANVNNQGKIFTTDHWAYKTLENVTRKYGLLVGKPEEQFDSAKPLTRNEAAILLVSLVGKIKQNNYELSESEKIRIEILRQELKHEIQSLVGRVASLEDSVDTLKGTISNLEKSDKKQWLYGIGEDFRIKSAFQFRYTGIVSKGADNYPANFRIPKSEITFLGKLKPHLNYKVTFRADRAFTSSKRGLLDDSYIVTDILPHHKIYLGQTRIPIGKEGTTSSTKLDTVDRSQIARNFSDIRDIGLKIVSNRSFIDYTIGAYNGNEQNRIDTNNGMDLATWAVIKPLYKHPEYGKLELGGGYKFGRRATIRNQDITSYYAGYKYKKYMLKTEYTEADNYLTTDVKAHGWYVHNSFDCTDKLQLIARIDQFDPNIKVAHNATNEYTLGANYYFSGHNLKLQLNLVNVDNEAGKNSNRVGIQTQYKF